MSKIVGKSGALQSMGSQRVRSDWAVELNWCLTQILRSTYRGAQGSLLNSLCDLNGKEAQKEGMSVHVPLIHFAVWQKVTLESNCTPTEINLRKRARKKMPPKRTYATSERWTCAVDPRPAVGSGGHKQLACCCSKLLLFRVYTVSAFWPHGMQHTRLPCPFLSPRVCPSSCPLNHLLCAILRVEYV